jgi:probable F420-dependent oxidoreductase
VSRITEEPDLMELWLEARPNHLSEIAALCDVAEQARLPGIAFNEMKSPPDLAACIALGKTTHTRVVTSLLIAFPRSPTVAAYGAWHLQDMSSGRFELGLGTQVKGHIERRFGMQWYPPKPRMREYVSVVRALWRRWQTGEPINFKGSFYTVDLMTPDFDPGPLSVAPPRLHTGGLNEGMCELAGELSDGLIIAEPVTKRYTDEVILPALDRGLATSNRSRSDVVITGGAYIGVGETEDEVREIRELIRYRIAFYSSTRTYRRPLEMEGWGDISDVLHDLTISGQWDRLAEHITDEMLDTFAVIGRYDSISEKIAERYGHFADRVYVGPLFSKSLTPSNLRLLSTSLERI